MPKSTTRRKHDEHQEGREISCQGNAVRCYNINRLAMYTEQIIGEFNCWKSYETVRFSQRNIAEILGVSKQAVSLVLVRYEQFDTVCVKQTQGVRLVSQSTRLYPASAVVFAGQRGGRPMAEFIRTMRDAGIECPDVVTDTRSELRFGSLLCGSLDGIASVKCQHPVGKYVVDFYISDLRLVVEYDEPHHTKTTTKDGERQAELERLGCEVVRVEQGSEIAGLNTVMRKIMEYRTASPSLTTPADLFEQAKAFAESHLSIHSNPTLIQADKMASFAQKHAQTKVNKAIDEFVKRVVAEITTNHSYSKAEIREAHIDANAFPNAWNGGMNKVIDRVRSVAEEMKRK